MHDAGNVIVLSWMRWWEMTAHTHRGRRCCSITAVSPWLANQKPNQK